MKQEKPVIVSVHHMVEKRILRKFAFVIIVIIFVMLEFLFPNIGMGEKSSG